MSRRFRYETPGEDGEPVVTTMTEDDIMDTFFPAWALAMHQLGHADHITPEHCLEDWRTMHDARRMGNQGGITMSDVGLTDKQMDEFSRMVGAINLIRTTEFLFPEDGDAAFAALREDYDPWECFCVLFDEVVRLRALSEADRLTITTMEAEIQAWIRVADTRLEVGQEHAAVQRSTIAALEQENALLRQGMKSVTLPLPNACVPCETVCADCTPQDAIGHSEDLIEDADTSIESDAQAFRDAMQEGTP